MGLEKGIETEAAIGASDAQIQVMPSGEEKELPISDLCVAPAVTDGDVIAATMNTGKNKNKSLKCWLVVTASVMFLSNYIQSAPKYQLIPLEPMVIFTMFMCAILVVFHTMKQM